MIIDIQDAASQTIALEWLAKASIDATVIADGNYKELTAEVERVKREASANLWTMAGVGIAVIGAIAMAFTGVRVFRH